MLLSPPLCTWVQNLRLSVQVCWRPTASGKQGRPEESRSTSTISRLSAVFLTFLHVIFLGPFLLLGADCEVPVIFCLAGVRCHQLKLTNLNPPKCTWNVSSEMYRVDRSDLQQKDAGHCCYDAALWLAVCRLGELPRHLGGKLNYFAHQEQKCNQCSVCLFNWNVIRYW